jgi:hypothetical protein
MDRLAYLAIYECKDCHNEEAISRHFRYQFGPECRCPKCGTYRLSKLKVIDKIDKMVGGMVNLFNRLAGGKLYHCCLCRLQFYDRRPLAARPTREPATAAASESQHRTATSGV